MQRLHFKEFTKQLPLPPYFNLLWNDLTMNAAWNNVFYCIYETDTPIYISV